MTGEELVRIGRELARPCLCLQEDGDGDPAAIWGGPGVVPSPEGPYRHLISLERRWLPENLAPGSGWLSVYVDDQDCETGVVAVDGSASLGDRVREGARLYAGAAVSLPPIDAVFRFGPAAVEQWLRANDWDAAWGYNPNFRDRATTEVYERAYQDSCPLYQESCDAVVGGWHFPWPDGDWEDLLEQSLILWTFREAEPWVEVWRDPDGEFTVIQRVT